MTHACDITRPGSNPPPPAEKPTPPANPPAARALMSHQKDLVMAGMVRGLRLAARNIDAGTTAAEARAAILELAGQFHAALPQQLHKVAMGEGRSDV